jgi:hypothetical protein
LNGFRIFDDVNSNGLFFPSNTNLIFIVERTDMRHVNCFPFELRLECTFRVDVHDRTQSSKFKFTRFIANNGQGTIPEVGWCFHIRGNYDANLAKAAVESALDEIGNIAKIPPNIGLEAAIPEWMIATSR